MVVSTASHPIVQTSALEPRATCPRRSCSSVTHRQCGIRGARPHAQPVSAAAGGACGALFFLIIQSSCIIFYILYFWCSIQALYCKLTYPWRYSHGSVDYCKSIRVWKLTYACDIPVPFNIRTGAKNGDQVGVKS